MNPVCTGGATDRALHERGLKAPTGEVIAICIDSFVPTHGIPILPVIFLAARAEISGATVRGVK